MFAPARDALDVRDTTAESDLPVLQIAGLGLLGAVTTTALMITVARRKLDERYGR